ncbi:MAG: hypothetical protein HXM40_05300, partial [Stomatobaculum longum]|nr:hypothetical protein [Stomatobaculum longum]
ATLLCHPGSFLGELVGTAGAFGVLAHGGTHFVHRRGRLLQRCGLLLGAGGAARSAAVLAATGGAAELVILNRNPARAEALAKAVRDINPSLTVRAAALEHWRKLPGNDYLCIQCTSVGMWPNAEESIVEDPRFFEKLSAAADIVYTPEETKFLRLARAAGKPVAGGLAMLISQGAHAFSLWTGKRCTAEQEEELLTLAKGALPA